MPTLARFYGIKVYVYWRDHPPPHVHVDYQGRTAVLEIATLQIIESELPRRALTLVLEWAVLHRGELDRAWRAAQRLETPPTIEPLG